MSTAGWLEAVGLQAVWSLVPLNCSLTTIALTTVLALAMLAGGWPWVFGLAVVELLVGVWLCGRPRAAECCALVGHHVLVWA